MPQILIFGDSIAYGAWDAEGGWAERLKIFSNKKSIETGLEFYCAIYNLSIDGDITGGVLERFELEAKKRLLEEKTILIFSIGINDSCFIKNTDEFLTPLKKFKNNIQKLISGAKKSSKKIIFIGLTPVDEEKTNPYFASTTGKSYKNKFIKKYDNAIKNICAENKTDFIEIFTNFEKNNYIDLLEDGLHPNTEGHKKIFEIIKNHLMKNKII